MTNFSESIVQNKMTDFSIFSNFSGSYGFCLILKDKNYLFVDGRYSLQAKKQSGKYFKIVTFPDQMPYDILKQKINNWF